MWRQRRQVVGALEYKGEAERLQETQRVLKQSLEQLATAPLAQQEPVLVERIIQRSNELQSSVEGMLQRGQRRHLERNALLSSLYQNQSYLRHLQKLTGAQDDALLGQMDRLIVAAIDTPTPRSVVKQLDAVMPALPLFHANPLISGILNDFNQELHKLEPLSSALDHESWDDAVEDKAVIEAFFYQTDEVVYGVRRDFRVKLCFHHIAVFHSNCNDWVRHHCFPPDF